MAMWCFACGRSRAVRLTLDDCGFQLYRRYTSWILIVASIVVLLREWSVDSVDCALPTPSQTTNRPLDLELFSTYRLNTYCKLHSRFSPVSTNNCATLSTPAPMPQHHWFALVLFTFAIALQLPYHLWRCFARSILESSSTTSTLDQWVADSSRSESRCYRATFAMVYLMVKLLNPTLLTLIIYLTDLMLQRHFIFYPILFWNRFQDRPCQRDTSSIFPKSSLCSYVYQNGSEARTIEVHCLMPINALLEQVFLLLWVWFALVLLLTLGDLARYLFSLCSTRLRVSQLKYQTNCIWKEEAYLECSRYFSTWLLTTILWINNARVMNQTKLQEVNSNQSDQSVPMIPLVQSEPIRVIHGSPYPKPKRLSTSRQTLL